MGNFLAKGSFGPPVELELGSDRLRVRVGPLVGLTHVLTDVGIVQGRRPAVHLFGVLMRTLIDSVEGEAHGVGIDPPPGSSACMAE